MLDPILQENLIDEYHSDKITVQWNEVLEECIVDLEEKDATR